MSSLPFPQFLDVVYAELMRDLPQEERARLDGELELPLGVTSESLEARKKEWMAANGWQ